MASGTRKLLLVPIVLLFWTAALAAQLRQIAIIDIPGHPGFNTVALAGSKVVIAHPGADTVDIFDPAKRRVIAIVHGMQDPHGIAVNELSGTVYVANSGNNTIAVISTDGWRVERQIQLQYTPDALLFVPELNTLYVTNPYNESLSAVRAAGAENASAIAQTVSVSGRPEDLAYDPARKLLYCTVQDHKEVLALDPNLRIAARYPLAASQPTGLALDAKNRYLFVAVRYAVLVLDADSGKEIARVPTDAGADALWYDEPTRSVYAAMTGGTVSMIRAQNGRFASEQELKTDVRGHTLAFDSSRQLVYMPGGREGRSKLAILKRVENAAPSTAAEAQLH
jgi:DNA-binding beta-propeller fold protein YncE